VEYFGVITGLLYLWLEIRQHRMMWVVGVLTSLVYMWVFFSSHVYATMGLQLYYAVISVYGFWMWSRGAKRVGEEEPDRQDVIRYRHLTWPLAAGIALSLALIYGGIYYVLSAYTDSAVPVGDAITTSLGIVGTWMLARRIIEHWWVWVVADGLSVYIYYSLGLYPTMFLYLCYALLAVAGYYTWKKKGEKTDADAL
jgi:nicotinamide mononucleotide transporter